MAKRKRLEPARAEIEAVNPSAAIPAAPGQNPMLSAGLETKSLFPTLPADLQRRPPIADIAGDAAAMSALQELSQTLTAARAEGRLVLRLPLDAIDATYLVRDRIEADMNAEDMQALCDSLRKRGQQAPIEVADLGEGPDGPRWGLISGWRRLTALRRLRAEGAITDTVLAIARQPAEAAEAYLGMVEENEIRVGLSFYERARIVVKAADRGVFKSDRLALAELFHAVPRSKRSKIGSFVRIVRALDPVLRFPTTLSERSGLALAGALDRDPTLAKRLFVALGMRHHADASAEAHLIAKTIAQRPPEGPDVVGQAPEDDFPPLPKPPRQDPAVTLQPGLTYALRPNGSVVLQGAALADPAYRDRLMAALAVLK